MPKSIKKIQKEKNKENSLVAVLEISLKVVTLCALKV